MRRHSSNVALDVPYEEQSEPLRFRIRAGEPGRGKMMNLEFAGLKFCLTAAGGDYLVYDGGMELYHYDKNFHLLETAASDAGEPVVLSGLQYITMNYLTDEDDSARYLLTEFRREREYFIHE